MWVFLNDSFLSIVAHNDEPGLLHVRARIKGDIEAAFPEAQVTETPSGDYRFRASLPRERVSARLAELASAIDYTNFKDSVRDPARHHAYLDVWGVMSREQKRRTGP